MINLKLMNRSVATLVLVLFGAGCITAAPSRDARVFDITTYGAKPDGQTLCTMAIQKAIDACGAAGGGTVVFPPGRFLSGTLFLKSAVTLRLDEKATLLGSTNGADYPKTPPVNVRSFNDGRTQKQLIFGENLKDIAITGRGTIDGQGGSFPMAPRGATPDRPFVIRLVACKNILIENINLHASAFWMQHYLECDDLTVRGINVVNHSNWNNDTIDIDGCHRVRIENLTTDSSDDGITLKSTSLRACEDVTVSNCLIHTHAVGIKFGTESIGGFKRIRISNCDIKRSAFRKGDFGGRPNGKGGIGLMSLDGAAIENVEISNIRIEGTVSPIYLRLHDRGRVAEKGKGKPIGYMRNITLRDITATDAETTGSLVSGIPGHPIENLTLRNVSIQPVGGVKQSDVKLPIDELAKGSGAGPGMFGLQPASGIHFHYVNNLTLDNVVVKPEQPDERPGLIFSYVEGLKFNGKSLSADSEKLPDGVAFLKQYVVPAALESATSVRSK